MILFLVRKSIIFWVEKRVLDFGKLSLPKKTGHTTLEMEVLLHGDAVFKPAFWKILAPC